MSRYGGGIRNAQAKSGEQDIFKFRPYGCEPLPANMSCPPKESTRKVETFRFIAMSEYSQGVVDDWRNNSEDAFLRVRWGASEDFSGAANDDQQVDLDFPCKIELSTISAAFSLCYPVSLIAGVIQPPLDIKISGGLGGGSGPGEMPSAKRTQILTTPLGINQTSAFFEIPKWAIGATLTSRSPGASSLRINQYHSALWLGFGPHWPVSMSQITKNVADIVPLTNGAKYYTITNNSGVSVVHARVIWWYPF